MTSPRKDHRGPLNLNTTFHVICKVAPRSLGTVHSLQCLKGTRVLSLLPYHIGNHCVHGPGILENQTKVFKEAIFYKLDIPAVLSRRSTPPVLTNRQCLPRRVIEGCVKDIVQSKCGKSTAELTVKYITFHIEQDAKYLSELGLSPIQCDSDHISQYGKQTPSGITLLNSSHTLLGEHYNLVHARPELDRMSLTDAVGTGLDTVFGKRLMLDLRKFETEINPCGKYLLFLQYEACVLFSDARHEPPSYSILQSAHGLLNVLTQGKMCSRLNKLVACWNLQKEVCGPAARGFEHDFILQIESCNIQQYMESIQCDWQDMLFEFYLDAAQKTAWPLAEQSGEPRYLDNARYEVGETVNSFEHFIQLLEPGVGRIASRCGSEAAERLQKVFWKLKYTLADTFILKEEIHR